jgi:putative hydrolase
MAALSRSSSIFQSRYLFHMHTSVTDGKLEIEDYFSYACLHGFDKLIFLEHIRRTPTYDVEKFITGVKEASQSSGIPALVGFEAKILPDGSLDLDEKYARQADVLGIAEHGFSGDLAALSGALTECFCRYKNIRESEALVWVHPGLYFKKHGLLTQEHRCYSELLERAVDAGILLERNMRYDLIPQVMYADLNPACRVLGADAHSAGDLARYLTWLNF